MNYLLDTCVISDFFKKEAATITRFQSVSPKQLHVSAITVMEIEYGLKLNPEREKKIRPIWESLTDIIQIILFSTHCAQQAALLRANLKNSCQPIGPYDILIAGTALANDMTVITSNMKEFIRMPEIKVENLRGSLLPSENRPYSLS